MTPEEKAEQYADSHNLKCASDSHAFVEVSLREQWENSRDAFLAGCAHKEAEISKLKLLLEQAEELLAASHKHLMHPFDSSGIEKLGVCTRTEELLEAIRAALASQGE